MAKMWKLLAGVVLLCGGAAGLLAMQEAPSELLKIADRMVQQVVQLRGLEPKGEIRKGVKSRDEIAQFLKEHVRENYEADELQNEGVALQKLGLIPEDIDYAEFALRLLTEQVGGYYDPDKKTFFIAAWLPVEQQKPVMVHELTHALQDQAFELNRILKEDRKLHNDDRVLAHQAIFEGDAMAVMLDYLLTPAGKNFAQLPDLAQVMRAQFAMMDAQFSVFKSAPMYLKETLLFPYGYGASFLQKIRVDQPWEAVNRVYSDLPSSTEQIIHPEKYFRRRDDPKPVRIEDPARESGGAWKPAYRNVLGEFSTYLMLKQRLPEERARQAAAGWGGDEVLLQKRGDGRSAVFVATVWDAPAEAEEFFGAMKEWFRLSFPGAAVEETADGAIILVKDERHTLRRNGAEVRFTVGVPASDAGMFRF
jgi:hypothetical protein